MRLPRFNLADENGEMLDSSLLKGMRRIVCLIPDLGEDSVRELCEFDGIYQKLMVRNIVMLMVIDAEPSELRKVMDDNGLRLKLLSDTHHMLSRECGAEGRTTYMVSKEGDIVAEWKDVSVDGHASAVYDRVKLLFK